MPRLRRLGRIGLAFAPSAEAFVYPSLAEGFGLPVVEAMASGVPVITSNNSALREVAGDAALLVDPTDPAALRDAMARLLADGDLRQGLAQRGLRRAASFSWQRCARETLAVYEHALGG